MSPSTSFLLASFIETRYRAAEMTRLYVSATAASQAKSSFLNMAAHELLTPLTVFTEYLSLLSGGSLGKAPDAWETPVNILMQKTREMERIVSDLQNASSLEVVDPNLGREVIDLCKIVNESSRAGSPSSRAVACRAAALMFPPEAVRVEADEDHLGRVMDDLINNAFTYTIRTPRLVIGLSKRSRKAIVEVEDNGAGIPTAERERVFDRLYRVVDPQVVVPGIGLGLDICRRARAELWRQPRGREQQTRQGQRLRAGPAAASARPRAPRCGRPRPADGPVLRTPGALDGNRLSLRALLLPARLGFADRG